MTEREAIRRRGRRRLALGLCLVTGVTALALYVAWAVSDAQAAVATERDHREAAARARDQQASLLAQCRERLGASQDAREDDQEWYASRVEHYQRINEGYPTLRVVALECAERLERCHATTLRIADIAIEQTPPGGTP